MSEIQYSYALDEDNNLVFIEDLTTKNRKGKNFKCLNCGEPMISRLGKIKQHHFAHNGNHSCSEESYFHKLFKHLFVQKFNNAKEFKIKYNTNIKCYEFQSCGLFNLKTCFKPNLETFNLKESYKIASEEKEYNGFIADILLESTKEEEPIFIEINHSNPCSTEKIASKIRIIEIDIKDELDLQKINLDCLEESHSIKFYNFNRISKKTSNDIVLTNICKFLLHIDGNHSILGYNENDKCNCKEVSPKSVFEITLNKKDAYNYDIRELGYFSSYIKGIKVKSCFLCKNYIESYPSICNKYQERMNNDGIVLESAIKKYMYPYYSNAKYCQFYEINEERLSKVNELVAHIPIKYK